ncbi:hypothetical protein BCR44DRAFT_1222671 [Catenaria anguillulae PL171]|uniref:Uncharacterized protein n=1 Tax=Catenaria anguillulae PL171 TaxID=765915 RepID=A0A1Y2HED0_9FUNG|nr:hypothetical protein BCR44DRAFT_1222671 [Catenaria anguillulae PL171]
MLSKPQVRRTRKAQLLITLVLLALQEVTGLSDTPSQPGGIAANAADLWPFARSKACESNSRVMPFLGCKAVKFPKATAMRDQVDSLPSPTTSNVTSSPTSSTDPVATATTTDRIIAAASTCPTSKADAPVLFPGAHRPHPCAACQPLRLCDPRTVDPTISKRFSCKFNIFASTLAYIESHGGLPAVLPKSFDHHDVFPLVAARPDTYTPESVVMSWPNGFDRATGACLTRHHAGGGYIDENNELYRKLNSRASPLASYIIPPVPHIDDVTPLTVLNGFALWLQLATFSTTTVSPGLAWRVCQLVATAQSHRKRSRLWSRCMSLDDIVPTVHQSEVAVAPPPSPCAHLDATGCRLREYIALAKQAPVAPTQPSSAKAVVVDTLDSSIALAAASVEYAQPGAVAQQVVATSQPGHGATDQAACAGGSDAGPSRPSVAGKIAL